MGTQNKTKINRLVGQWTAGTPRTTSSLAYSGFSRNLVVKYKNSGWLEPFGRGAYIRSGDKVDWPGALYTLQTQLGLPVHAGGKTALERKGYVHYLATRERRVFLYGPRGLVLPVWFTGERFGVEFVVTRTNLFPAAFPEAFTEFPEKDFRVRISAPELAMLEMLHLVPKAVGFDEAGQVMGNLSTLRPEVVQPLLEACGSVKVKRLFLYLAERHDHAWFAKLDPGKVDLGTGKRMIVPKGRYDAKYQITVPVDRDEVTP
jgi:hypothetical protein